MLGHASGQVPLPRGHAVTMIVGFEPGNSPGVGIPLFVVRVRSFLASETLTQATCTGATIVNTDLATGDVTVQVTEAARTDFTVIATFQ